MPTTIAFKELDGSPKESWGANGATATREVLCAWSDRIAFKDEILGDGYEFGTAQAIEYPGQAGVIAMTVSCQRFGKQQATEMTDLEADLTSYDDFAKLTIGYRQINSMGQGGSEPGHEGGTILSYSTSGAAEYVLLSPNGMTWANLPDTPVPEKAAPTKRVPLTQHQLSWHLVTSPPWEALKNQSGTVNNAAFLGYPADSLLFDSYTASKEFATASDFANPLEYWKIDFVFLSRHFIGWIGRDADDNLLGGENGLDEGDAIIGWQHVWRPVPSDNPAWDKLLHGAAQGGAAGSPPYVQSNFNNLLVYP